MESVVQQLEASRLGSVMVAWRCGCLALRLLEASSPQAGYHLHFRRGRLK